MQCTWVNFTNQFVRNSERYRKKANVASHTVQGGNSQQNFVSKFIRFFVTLGLKILRLFSFKVLFEADIINGRC